MLAYINYVRQLAYALQSIEIKARKKEIAFAVLKGLPLGFKNQNWPSNALKNLSKLLTYDYVRSKTLQDEQ